MGLFDPVADAIQPNFGNGDISQSDIDNWNSSIMSSEEPNKSPIIHKNDVFQIEVDVNGNGLAENSSSIGIVFTDEFISKTNIKGEHNITDSNGTLGSLYIGCESILLETTKTTLSVLKVTCKTSYESPKVFGGIQAKGKVMSQFRIGNVDTPHIGHKFKFNDITDFDAKIEGGGGFHTYEGTLGYEANVDVYGNPYQFKNMTTGTYGGLSISGSASASGDGNTYKAAAKWKYTGGIGGKGQSYETEIGIPEKYKKKKK
ncbi:TPA: hypothetical protein EYP45_04940 [Candidatus Peregrinibacteria bacterium]|nr:hypothetical protein [Candidatus Peregrinibacteria bacterium]